MIWLVLLLLAAAPPDPEARVIEYLRANVKPGQRVVVSELVNTVFTAPEERAALNRLFNTFFKMPLYLAQHQIPAPPILSDALQTARRSQEGGVVVVETDMNDRRVFGLGSLPADQVEMVVASMLPD